MSDTPSRPARPSGSGRGGGSDRRALGALAGTPDLDRWVQLTTDERVVIGTGKVELGQGIRTALTAIAADELGVDPARIDVLSASTGTTPNERVTAGSGSIEQSGTAVRQACAHARRILLARAADHLAAPAAEFTVEDGRITAPSGASVSYWELAGGRPFDYRVTEPGQTLPASERRYTGVGLARTDLPAKLWGEPVYVHDLRLPGTRHARVVRPPAPGARLVALADGPELGDVTIVRRGSFVAVVADREADAVRAVEQVRAACQWTAPDPADTRGDTAEALVAGATAATPIVAGAAVDGQPGPPLEPTAGHTIVRARYTKPFILHGSIGPSAAVARFDGGRLDVWSHSQGVEVLRLALAPVVGLEPEVITVHHMDGAGCYGHNGADDAACDAALVALALPGAPISLKWSRGDEHGWEPTAPAMAIDLEASVDEAGRICTWQHDIYSPPHGSRPRPLPGRLSGLLASWYLDPPFDRPPARPGGGFHSGAHRNADPLYDVGERRIVSHLVPRPPLRTSSTRSLGAFANVFAIESMADELAAAAEVDPVAFRLRHLAHDDRARTVIETAVELAGGLQAPGGVEAPGRGLAFARYENMKTYVAVVAEVAVDARTGDVRMTHGWIAADAGEVIDPDGLVNQLEGGVVQAASWTLKEKVGLGETGVTTLDWESYPILRFSDAPRLTTALLPGPGRALGAGEASAGPTAAAIANAFAQATGVRIRDLPLRSDRVRAALQAAL